jgi:hypothetical protein
MNLASHFPNRAAFGAAPRGAVSERLRRRHQTQRAFHDCLEWSTIRQPPAFGSSAVKRDAKRRARVAALIANGSRCQRILRRVRPPEVAAPPPGGDLEHRPLNAGAPIEEDPRGA